MSAQRAYPDVVFDVLRAAGQRPDLFADLDGVTRPHFLRDVRACMAFIERTGRAAVRQGCRPAGASAGAMAVAAQLLRVRILYRVK